MSQVIIKSCDWCGLSERDDEGPLDRVRQIQVKVWSDAGLAGFMSPELCADCRLTLVKAMVGARGACMEKRPVSRGGGVTSFQVGRGKEFLHQFGHEVSAESKKLPAPDVGQQIGR